MSAILQYDIYSCLQHSRWICEGDVHDSNAVVEEHRLHASVRETVDDGDSADDFEDIHCRSLSCGYGFNVGNRVSDLDSKGSF